MKGMWMRGQALLLKKTKQLKWRKNYSIRKIKECSEQNFDEMVAFRKNQAKSSVIVQVGNPSTSAGLVEQICSKHGIVKFTFHYKVKDKELLLLQLDSEDAVNNLLSTCSHNSSVKIIPSASPFLWLRAMPSSRTIIENTNVPMFTEDAQTIDNLEELLCSAKSVSDQLNILEEQTRLSEIGHRVRWITCVQIEKMLSGLFPSLEVLPFGSFVNGCGRIGCDLDMAISLDGYCRSEEKTMSQSPLVFQAKAALSNPRLQNQKHIELVADILQNFTTGCTQVQRVLQARVPIVKFYHEFAGVDCDISIGSLTGVFTSEMLYLYGEMDWRFRPLVTAVRFWAAWTRLTDVVPSPKITNFTLTLLVLFHLQRCTPPVLPTLNEMVSKARPGVDKRVSNDVDCSFLRDPSEFRQRSKKNQESLEDLFLGFFRFIEKYQFNERSVSIVSGNAARKSDSKPLHVQNPFERELNVSRNVNQKELTRLVMEARNALYILETKEGQSSENWGLLALPRAEKVRRLNHRLSYHTNLIPPLDMKDLFSKNLNENENDFGEGSQMTNQVSLPSLTTNYQTQPTIPSQKPIVGIGKKQIAIKSSGKKS